MSGNAAASDTAKMAAGTAHDDVKADIKAFLGA